MSHVSQRSDDRGNAAVRRAVGATALLALVCSTAAYEDRAAVEPPPRGPLELCTEAVPADARDAVASEDFVALGRAWVQKARHAQAPRYYDNAGACAQLALERAPDSSTALTLWALVRMQGHEFEAVVELCRRVLTRDGDDPLAWALLSDAQLELGDLDAAVTSAQRMMDQKPALPAYARAAHLRWLQGDVSGAKLLYRQAIRVGQHGADREALAWVLSEAALVFWHEGDYDGADAGFDLALDEKPDHAPALLGKGRVALARGRHATAASWFARADAMLPTAQSAWLLADALDLSGQGKRARESQAQVVRRGAHDPRTLALFYATRGRDLARAVELARSEWKQRRDPYTRDALAWALFRAGEREEARRVVEPLLDSSVPDVSLRYHAGAILAASGAPERGRELQRAALAQNPGFDPWLTRAEGGALAFHP